MVTRLYGMHDYKIYAQLSLSFALDKEEGNRCRKKETRS